MTAVIEYPATKEHPAFQANLRVNFISGEGERSATKIIGSEGVINLDDDQGFTIYKSKMPVAPGIGGWDSLYTYPEAMQKDLLDEYNKKYSAADKRAPSLAPVTYHSPQGYNSSNDHFANFMDAIRTGKPVVEDAVFGFRAAAPALACNDSYFHNKVIHWDAEHMKVVG
jgi:hypothetical protein